MEKIFDNVIFKTFMGIFKFLFFFVMISYIAFILVQRFTNNGSVFGYRVFTVATGSMAGVYDINDVIAVKNYDTNKLKVGDDVAYVGNKGEMQGLMITHRIVKIDKTDTGRIFTTKGVAAPLEDPKITEDQIIGKVVGTIPIITQLNHIVKSQLGFFLLVFVPLVLIIVLEILQTITDAKIDKEELKLLEKEERKLVNSSDVKKQEDKKVSLKKDVIEDIEIL